MTDQQHPITPPPELVEDWIELAKPLPQRPPNPGELATLAARWGADQELEACCAYIVKGGLTGHACGLQLTRRPKPSSMKEQALVKLAAMERLWEASGNEPSDLVRRALEQLDD